MIDVVEVKFYDHVEDHLLTYAVMVSRYQDKWVFVRHRDRDGLKCPGGKRNVGESIEECDCRELWEESGASLYSMYPVGVYCVCKDENETFGVLYYVEVEEFDDLPESEIAEVVLLDTLPSNWTYPDIQPHLFKKIQHYLDNL